MLKEGKTEDAIVILERQRKSAETIEGKSDVAKLLTAGYAQLGKWEEVERLVDEGFEGRDDLLLDMAQRACEKKDWRTVEELLAFDFKGREDIQRELASEYYDRGEWDDAELLLADLFRGRKEYTAEGLKAMHMLANIKYNKKDYEEAEDYAVRAVNGRRIILGTQHVFYYQSVNLLVKVYEAMGDAASVAETSAMLPIGFRCILLHCPN
jgi:Tetratricopeptide repeat